MVTKRPFNPESIIETINFIDGLENHALLENSSIIYSSNVNSGKRQLENYIRFENLTIDQLSEENLKLDKLIESASTGKYNVPETTLSYMKDMKKLVSGKIFNFGNMNSITDKYKLDLLDDSQCLKEDAYQVPNDVTPHGEDVVDIFDKILSKRFINAVGIMYILNELFDSDIFEDNLDELKDLLKNKIKDTIKYQMNNSKTYSDVPMITSLDLINRIMCRNFIDKAEVVNCVNEFICDIKKDICKEDTGFVANPYNVYTLTPFPVGVRTVASTLCDIANAETDEELIESLNAYSRMELACEVYGDSILTEDGSALSKGARSASRKVNKGLNDVTHKNNDKLSQAKTTIKKAIDPMTKFIETTASKIKKADHEERRNLIIKGGIIPKVKRFLRRAIEVGITGSINPVLGGIVLLGRIASDKYMDKRVRAQILRELEDELNIVNEKIEDSRGDENKQKKYELMRIKSKLNTEFERVKYNMKYS